MTSDTTPTAGRNLYAHALSARLVAVFAVLTVALIAGTYFFHRSQERYQTSETADTLAAVSRLKVDQISRWRQNLLADGAVLSEDASIAGEIRRHLAAPSNATRAVLTSALMPWKSLKQYADIDVVTPRGEVVFSLVGGDRASTPADIAAMAEAFRTHAPALTDLHADPGLAPHVTIVAPVFTHENGGLVPLAVVRLRRYAGSDLYGLIRSWPTASASAETLMVRRADGYMVFLNDLRHHEHAALELRIPLSRRNNPAVLAGSGVTGFVRAVDYRGVRVFADLRPVPGAGWFVVAKMDEAEALAGLRAGMFQTGALLAGFLLALSALFFAILQGRAKGQYRQLVEAGEARWSATAKLAAIVDSAHDAVIAVDCDGLVTAWNQSAEHLYGYSAAEVIGHSVMCIVPPEAEQSERELHVRMARGERIDPCEVVRITKDGRRLDISISISPIRDSSGGVAGFSRMTRDITQEKHLRREVEQLRWMLSPPVEIVPAIPANADCVCHMAERNRSRTLLNAAGDSLLAEIAAGFHTLMGTCFAVHEANGDFACNVVVSEWCRLLHRSSAQACGGDGTCTPETCRRWRCYRSCGIDVATATLATGHPVDTECLGGLKIYSVPIHAGGEVVGTMSVGYGDPTRDPVELAALAEEYGADPAELARLAEAYETRPRFIVELAKQRLESSARLLGEIVQRRRSEILLRDAGENLIRSNRELERFAYVASHDLQEPLRMVASYTQLLAHRYGDQLDQDAHDFIAYAVDGATRMKQLIEDLLSYSRLTARAKPPSGVDGRHAVTLALRNLEASVRESAAEITTDELPTVLADATQIVQLFQNLISNAIKFHTPGVAPKIHIDALRIPGEPPRWQFRVADNGIGIDPKHFDRVFVIFQRLHTRQEYPGTGIGLALCQRIVERHGGRIWIESEVGQGTAFLFTLPGAEIEEVRLWV